MTGRLVLFLVSVLMVSDLMEWSFVANADAPVPVQGVPSPRFQSAGKARKNPYQKSRLTYDEAEALADKRKLLLTTGEDKAVDLDFEVNGGANGISYGNPQLVATTLVKLGDKRQLVFKPLKAGETNVTIRDNDGVIRLIFQVKVTGSNLLQLAGEIRNLLRDIEGLDIRVVGSKIILEGELLVPADYGRMLVVIQEKNYADAVLNLTTLSPFAMQVLAKKMLEDIVAFAPNVKSRVVNGMIFLEGTTDNIDQARRAESVAQLYLPEVRPGEALEARDPGVRKLPPRKLIWNFIVVNPPPPRKQDKLVKVTIHFVELSKDYDKVFGFKWMPGFTSNPQISVGSTAAGGAGAGSGANFSGTISSLLPKLQSAQTAGFARILKTGTIIVRSGQPANLTDQTQFPYVQQGSGGQLTSASANVGLSVAVTPMVIGQTEDIQLDLDLDQTNLVGRGAGSGAAPITASHKVKTKIYVKSNESAAVAGLNSNEIGTDFNKDDPGSGTFDQGTDPLFKLLRSKAFRKKKSQFVIFVTPQIVENPSDGAEELKKNFRVRVKG